MKQQPAHHQLPVDEANRILSSLTRKQTEVLELLLEQRTSKEIALALGIAPNTVDFRVKTLKERFGLSHRADLGRFYDLLKKTCGQTTCGSIVVDPELESAFEKASELPEEAVFLVKDSLSITRRPDNLTLVALEAIDRRFGKTGRVGLVVGLSAGTATVILLVLAIASTLGEIV